MLPFRVIQLEQYRALKQNAAKPYLVRYSPLTALPSNHNFATQSRRLSGLFWPGDFAAPRARNTLRPLPENEAVFQSCCATSTRFWSKSRSYRKQAIKPFLPGATTAPRDFQLFAKMHPNFGLFFAPISGAKSRGIA
jgi:hypothetical protein